MTHCVLEYEGTCLLIGGIGFCWPTPHALVVRRGCRPLRRMVAKWQLFTMKWVSRRCRLTSYEVEKGQINGVNFIVNITADLLGLNVNVKVTV